MQNLVNEQGQIAFGYTFADEINYLDYDLRNTMDKPLSAWYKKFKFNQFQFICLSSDDFIMGIAIVDLKYASNCFIYLYHLKSQTFEEFEFIQAFALNTQMTNQPNNGISQFTKGLNHISIHAQNRQRHISFKLKNGLSLQACIAEPNNKDALSLCSKAGYNGWVYTQKSAALTVEGNLNWQGQSYQLAALNTLASVDWSAGYMRRETNWYWASLSSYLDDGRRLGFNFASGVNETGFSENAIWLDDVRYKVDLVDFRFNRYNESQTWQLKSNDGKIEITFDMQGKRAQKLNLILIASNFRQFFGQFNGVIKINNETLTLNNAWGLVEDHYAKW